MGRREKRRGKDGEKRRGMLGFARFSFRRYSCAYSWEERKLGEERRRGKGRGGGGGEMEGYMCVYACISTNTRTYTATCDNAQSIVQLRGYRRPPALRKSKADPLRVLPPPAP